MRRPFHSREGAHEAPFSFAPLARFLRFRARAETRVLRRAQSSLDYPRADRREGRRRVPARF